MRATVTVAVASHGAREDALVEAPGSTPSGEVVSKLAELVGARPDDPVLLDGRPVDRLIPLASSGLRDGAVVSFGAPAEGGAAGRGARPRGYLELRVVGGPSAGAVHPLALGTTTIGRASTNDIVLDDDDVSRRHATLVVTASGVTVADAGSTNGTSVDGSRVGDSPVAIAAGAPIRMGRSALALAVPDEPPVALVAGTDGCLAYNRPPRVGPASAPVCIEFPVPPQERAPARLPVIATIAPLVAGVVLAAVMRRPEYLLFTVLSPVMMAAQWVADRVGHRRTARAEQSTYQTALAAARARLTEALGAEAADRRVHTPDPALLAKIVSAPSPRLWERRRSDPDFLRLTLGTGTLPAAVRVVNDTNVPVVVDVPVAVQLRDVGVLGIAGPPDRTTALARCLVGQLAALHSPRELAIVLLAEPTRAALWEWTRWLPHLRPAEPRHCRALVGPDSDSAAARIAEINASVTTGSEPTTDAREVVVVIDGARAMRDVPGLPELLSRAGESGVFAICLDGDESLLPEECAAVATFSGDTATRLSLRGSAVPTVSGVAFDGVSIGWSERIGRALAPLRDAGGGESAGVGRTAGLPGAVRWLELARLDQVSRSADLAAELGDELAERWRRSTGGSTAALLGAAATGSFTIDLAKDGPHALIAGTTGSGKSELLQTLVVSLAITNRPDELSFVLVDYKGGAAFGACAALPHTVGLVTDLDGRLVERA
ncbi:MAG: FtsK/SpoIIIE domain-containing protein, partial [Acidothermaceae bacterium]